MRKTLISMAVAATAALAGCSLIPTYERPAAPVEAAYPQGDAYPAANGAGQVPPAAELGWREYFADPRLQRLIDVALQNNRNLRVAALTRGGIPRAVPHPARGPVPAGGRGGAGHAAARAGRPFPPRASGSSAVRMACRWAPRCGRSTCSAGCAAWSQAALEQYFASDEARRSTHIALVASVANAYLTLRADEAQLSPDARDAGDLRAHLQSHAPQLRGRHFLAAGPAPVADPGGERPGLASPATRGRWRRTPTR